MSKWVKRDGAATIQEVVERNTGVSASTLLSATLESPQKIKGMYDAAELLSKTILRHGEITVVGDYDSDGLNATAIIAKLCRYYSAECRCIIPRRKTDGYGLSDNIVDKIGGGLVITIDNGITAVAQIKKLKDKGCKVIILDHHLPADTIPEADVVVDPHVDPEHNGFLYYCGAGLGYQLARLLLANDNKPAAQNLLQELGIHAAIATITDVVPLVDCNRRIVTRGLSMFNHPSLSMCCAGLSALRGAVNGEFVDETTVAYQVGPLINATPRLYDNGGASVLKALLCEHLDAAYGYMRKMVDINHKRKELVKEHTDRIIRKVEEQGLAQKGSPLVVCDDIDEGIAGIVAVNLCKAYKMPTVVLAKAADGTYRGSARSWGKAKLTGLLDAIRPHVIRCGGHAEAAGLTVAADKLDKVIELLHEAGQNLPVGEANDEILYDLDITEKAVIELYRQQNEYAPYGAGNELPVYVLHSATPTVGWNGQKYRTMGADGNSIKFSCGGYDIVGFSIAQKYIDMGCPDTFDVIGTISSNTFNGQTTIQFVAQDFR